MNILVVGCGKVGTSLCNLLSAEGHDVSVVNRTADAFSGLAPDFTGYTTLGVEIDQDVLKRAGVESCDALVAVTIDDNTNIMAAQLAKEFFHVPKVFARINDPSKCEVFSDIGIHTTCPTDLTVATLVSAINENEATENVCIGTHTMVFTEMNIPKEYIGIKVSDIKFEQNEVLIAVEHEDRKIEGIILNNHELIRGDKLIFAKFVD